MFRSIVSFTAFLSSLLLLSPCSASGIELPTTTDSDKVSLGLYYESLCPYSANFIINHLVKIFQEDQDLLSIVDLKLVPWGNAKLRGSDTFDCQHGPSECLLNTVEACAIDTWPKVSEHFPLIYCIENLVYEHKYPQWESCFKELGLDGKPIADCYMSGHGNELELAFVAETNSLDPPHQYVPWVVVNGKPLYEDYENFVSYICEAYNGTSVPKACSELSLNRVQLKRVNQRHRVCYSREETLSTILRQAKSYVNSAIQWVYDARL